MVTFTCPRCASRQQVDSLLDYEAVSCGHCEQPSRWDEVVDLDGQVLMNCPHCGTKLGIDGNTLEGSCDCSACKKRFLICSAPNLVGPGIRPLSHPAGEWVNGEKKARPSEQLDAALARLVNGLAAKEFTFVTPESSAGQMQDGLATFDDRRLWLTGKMFGFLMGGADLPEFARTIAGRVIGFGAEKADDGELAALQQLMRASSPLCAFGFSTLYGPRFAAVVNGDDVTEAGLSVALERFQQVNLCMMQLGGRLSLKLFGKAVAGFKTSAATGSLILVASTTRRADQLRGWLASRPLRNDTIFNQMKETFSRWQFWAKAVFGMIEYKPHQLRQEAVVLDAQANQATSTASARLPFEFGFGLGDVAG